MADWNNLMAFVDNRDKPLIKKKWALNCEKHIKNNPKW